MKSLWSRMVLCWTVLIFIFIPVQAVTVISGGSSELSDATTSTTLTTNIIEWRQVNHGKALIMENANMSSEKPTLIFFGGAGERASTQETVKLLEGTSAFENWNVCCVAVANDHGKMDEWKDVARSLKEYVLQRVRDGKINPENIWIDGYSNGGAGAYYATLELHNLPVVFNGTIKMMKVSELTLVEASLKGIFSSNVIENLLSMGIKVSMFVSTTSNYTLSAHGRDLVRRFNSYENFTGVLVEHGHGNAIVSLVANRYENHSNDGF